MERMPKKQDTGCVCVCVHTCIGCVCAWVLYRMEVVCKSGLCMDEFTVGERECGFVCM